MFAICSPLGGASGIAWRTVGNRQEVAEAGARPQTCFYLVAKAPSAIETPRLVNISTRQ